MTPPTLRRLVLLIAAVASFAACSGDSDDADGGDDSAAEQPAETTEAASDDTVIAGGGDAAEDAIDEAAEQLEELQDAVGGGGASLVMSDGRSWTFDAVLCAFGEDEIGQAGAEVVVSALADGLQLYASIDAFGHTVSINDIEDFENPSVSLSASQFSAELLGIDPEPIVLNGRQLTASTSFDDDTTDDVDGIDGTFEATCP
ncbi:MAG: hypothetical protein AAGD18_07340 [Actinomycetota bacterium]